MPLEGEAVSASTGVSRSKPPPRHGGVRAFHRGDECDAGGCPSHQSGGMSVQTFRGSTALADGHLRRRDLRRGYDRLHRDVYTVTGAALDARDKAVAAWQWNRGAGALSGWSAAAALGVQWVPDDAPAEVSRTHHVRSPRGIVVRKERLLEDEVIRVDGMLLTSPARTAYDLARRLRGEDAVIAVDAVCNTCVIPVHEVSDVARRHAGARGIVGLRRALAEADAGAESPWETRTRLAICAAGLPRPRTQVVVRDRSGVVIARLDLGWDRWRVGVEYDGAQHWLDATQRSHDLRRGNALAAAGWTVLRVNATGLRTRRFLDELRAVLRAAGAPLGYGPLTE
jgi:hypothetical protein